MNNDFEIKQSEGCYLDIWVDNDGDLLFCNENMCCPAAIGV